MPEDDRDRGFPFRLPPIRLPPLFPDRLRIVLPVPGYRHERSLSSGWILLVALLFDLLDAILALFTAGPVDLVRTVGGTFLSILVAGWAGAIYGWEVLAVAIGFPAFTAFPSLAVLVIVELLRARRQPERET